MTKMPRYVEGHGHYFKAVKALQRLCSCNNFRPRQRWENARIAGYQCIPRAKYIWHRYVANSTKWQYGTLQSAAAALSQCLVRSVPLQLHMHAVYEQAHSKACHRPVVQLCTVLSWASANRKWQQPV